MAEPPQPAGPSHESQSSTAAPRSSSPPDAVAEEDSDPDFDDLDDVLDQFSAATSSQPKPLPSSIAPLPSGPGRPAFPTSAAKDTTSLPANLPIPHGPSASESEEEFMTRLTAEMSSVISQMSLDPAASAATPEDIAKMGRELEEFTNKMEAEGVKPEDLLKAILGEEAGSKVGNMAKQEHESRESESQSKSRSPQKGRLKDAKTGGEEASKQKPGTASFEDTIRKTMARMESSSAAASSATAQSTQKSEEDLVAEMLRALESESGPGGEGDLSKMFLGMMEQLTNKDMLYEPMKELSTKFPSWLDENKTKLEKSEYERFSRQQVIVGEIVDKFEDKGYSDDDPGCREFVWEKMQAMQGEGAPPEELIANPFPGGMPGLGEGGLEGMEEGCATQ